MKLAEALQERADFNRNIEQLRVRLENNCIVQEGETTAEDPIELIKELDLSVEKLNKLMAAINLTNCTTIVDNKPLTAMIAQKDALSVKLSVYRDVINTASRTAYRATRKEIRILSAIDVKELQKKADEIAKNIRQIDNKLQETNWKTDINFI